MMRAYGLKHGLSDAVIDAEGKALRDWSLSLAEWREARLGSETEWRTGGSADAPSQRNRVELSGPRSGLQAQKPK